MCHASDVFPESLAFFKVVNPSTKVVLSRKARQSDFTRIESKI